MMASFPIKEGYRTVRHLGSVILKLYKWLMYSILVVKIEVIVIEKKNDTWIISMWPFNQYRVLKINVTRNIYHKAPDVHIFHIIDEKKTRWEKEQVPVRPLHWNSFSVYHHDWNDRTFRHVAAKRIAIVITRFEAILTCFYSFFTVLLLFVFFFAQFCFYCHAITNESASQPIQKVQNLGTIRKQIY